MWQRARAQVEFHPEMAALAGALLGCLITRSKQHDAAGPTCRPVTHTRMPVEWGLPWADDQPKRVTKPPMTAPDAAAKEHSVSAYGCSKQLQCCSLGNL